VHSVEVVVVVVVVERHIHVQVCVSVIGNITGVKLSGFLHKTKKHAYSFLWRDVRFTSAFGRQYDLYVCLYICYVVISIYIYIDCSQHLISTRVLRI
jgi:hypothetical protein